MNGDSFYQLYFNCRLETKEKVYSFISKIISGNDNYFQKRQIVTQLNEREKKGSILIADHVLLPHIESNQIDKSQILFIHLDNSIKLWDSDVKEIKLLIVILLKENENIEIKKRISSLTRTLADEDYLNYLLNIKTKENFYKEIIKP